MNSSEAAGSAYHTGVANMIFGETGMRGDLEEPFSIAKHAARLAPTVHLRAGHGDLDVRTKHSPIDLVTELDRESERQLVSAIRTARPDDAILGQKGTNVAGGSGVCWVLDSLDGTANFVHGYPAYVVSVGVEIDGQRVIGVEHDTYHDRVYLDIVGVGAQCDGRPISVRVESGLSRVLVGTGFFPNAAVRLVHSEVLRSVQPRVRDVRRSGCPSLALSPRFAPVIHPALETRLAAMVVAARAWLAAELYAWLFC
jgi:myo-inositol-1(or 4)-monophosphatase